tara:strand:- start:53 stop:325 length:273 start_codon:yes stop_codon:yes gene_type:complete
MIFLTFLLLGSVSLNGYFIYNNHIENDIDDYDIDQNSLVLSTSNNQDNNVDNSIKETYQSIEQVDFQKERKELNINKPPIITEPEKSVVY